MKRLAEDAAEMASGRTSDGKQQRRRRRLVQQSDLVPVEALQVPVPGGSAPEAGSALMQQLEEIGGVALPQVKPGGRRKRAVQARVDMDAASLFLGAVSKIQSACTPSGAPAASLPYSERPYPERSYTERPYNERPYNEQPYTEQPYPDHAQPPVAAASVASISEPWVAPDNVLAPSVAPLVALPIALPIAPDSQAPLAPPLAPPLEPPLVPDAQALPELAPPVALPFVSPIAPPIAPDTHAVPEGLGNARPPPSAPFPLGSTLAKNGGKENACSSPRRAAVAGSSPLPHRALSPMRHSPNLQRPFALHTAGGCENDLEIVSTMSSFNGGVHHQAPMMRRPCSRLSTEGLVSAPAPIAAPMAGVAVDAI
jgi:hypothetical protein